MIARNLASRRGESLRIDYPFTLHDGSAVRLPVRLFSISELARAFRACGLMVRARAGIHQLGNLLPSTILHRPRPGRMLRRAAAGLARLDRRVADVWPFWRLGCSVAYCLTPMPSPA